MTGPKALAPKMRHSDLGTVGDHAGVHEGVGRGRGYKTMESFLQLTRKRIGF
jgi:hypothetical protein